MDIIDKAILFARSAHEGQCQVVTRTTMTTTQNFIFTKQRKTNNDNIRTRIYKT